MKQYLEQFDFKGGKISFRLTKPDENNKQYSIWEIREGKFLCDKGGCGKIFNIGDSVKPIFSRRDKPPSNFVCIYCRGLLTKIE